MRVTINGKLLDLPPGCTLIAALQRFGLEPPLHGTAVAVNSQVVPQSKWESFVVQDQAKIEALTAMQGG